MSKEVVPLCRGWGMFVLYISKLRIESGYHCGVKNLLKIPSTKRADLLGK
jgi:hypothetical protein